MLRPFEAPFGWMELGIGFLAGSIVAAVIIYLSRKRIAHYWANRELDAVRELIAEGRQEEAAERTRRLLRETVAPEVVSQITRRQLGAVYEESGVPGVIRHVRDIASGVREELRRAEGEGIDERVTAILGALGRGIAPTERERKTRKR